MAKLEVAAGFKNIIPLGVFRTEKKALLLYLFGQGSSTLAFLDESSDGINFRPFQKNISISDEKGNSLNWKKCSGFRLSNFGPLYLMAFLYSEKKGKKLLLAQSADLITWQLKGKSSSIAHASLFISDYKFRGKYILYYGGKDIRMAQSEDLAKWKPSPKPLVLPKQKNSDMETLTIGHSEQGIELIYYQTVKRENKTSVKALFSCTFSKQNPQKVIHAAEDSIFEEPPEWQRLDLQVNPLGVVEIAGKLLSYWQFNNRDVYAIMHPSLSQLHQPHWHFPHLFLKKTHQNPILRPIVQHFWESKATFNPAAVYDEGKVHIIYRAIGDHDMSMLGYAASFDGVHIDERLSDPIYIPNQPFEYTGKRPADPRRSPFVSGGGGYGGVEDPRLTKIGDRFYMTYVAYDGATAPRVALTSIKSDDFLVKKWKWETPVLISRPGEVNKNAVIFPEKINGKYAIMHRVFPNILIDYVNSLDFDGSQYLKGDYVISPRITAWDSRKIAAGAPPLKTEHGWLLIYHAVGERDPSRYKIGAMLLDRDDPAKVLARTNHPVLEPVEHYENEGFKSGVAYPCGAVSFANTLFVYYGGADTVTCVATAKMDVFMDQLLNSSTHRYHHLQLDRVYN